MFDLASLPTGLVLAVSALLATLGWIYTARRARWLARKHHTFNTLTNVQFSVAFRKAFKALSTYLKTEPRARLDEIEDEDTRQKVRLILNHFEFISAGIRRGDIDEDLVHDTYRGTVRVYFEQLEDYIYSVRNARKRNAIFEHLEWLYVRWEQDPPGRIQRFFEWVKGSPFQGTRVRVRR